MKSLVDSLEAGNLSQVMDLWLPGGHRDRIEGFFQRYGQQGMRDYASYLRDAQAVERTDERAKFKGTYVIANQTGDAFVTLVRTTNGTWAVLQLD